MKTVGLTTAWLAARGLWWMLKTPIALAINAVRLRAHREQLLGNEVSCPTCGTTISLLGLWECGRCGYGTYGFFFSRCDVCGDVPPYLDCDRCGASMRNPLIFG